MVCCLESSLRQPGEREEPGVVRSRETNQQMIIVTQTRSGGVM